MQLNQVTKEQIREWIESPVAKAFLKAMRAEIEETEAAKGIDAYCPYEPQKTQEILANLNGYIDAMEVMVDAIERLAEDEEQVGD
jgi:hypothetical protein